MFHEYVKEHYNIQANPTQTKLIITFLGSLMTWVSL
jgi:hypothetical protein